MLRGTLRNKGFCAAWDVLVQLGCCEDTYEMEGVSLMTHRSFIESFLPTKPENLLKKKLLQFQSCVKGTEMINLRWSDYFRTSVLVCKGNTGPGS
jgi:hypothetical protein